MLKGSHMTDEQKIKLSLTMKEVMNRLEVKARISATLTGHRASPETRAKMSARQTGPQHSVSPETRAKMSASARARAKIFGPLSSQWKGGPFVWKRKRKAKRRLLGFIPLNAPFEGCEGHHVDSKLVIYMPKALHKSVYHNQYTGRGMAKINALAYDFLSKQ